MGEVLFSGIMGLFMIFFIVGSGAIEDLGGSDPIGPAGFPVLMASMGLILLGVIAVQAYREKRKDAEGEAAEKTALSPVALVTVLLLVLYVPTLNILGFIVSSFVLLSTMVFIFGCGSIKRSLIVGSLGTIVTVLLFGRILHVALPRGLALLRVLSYYIY